MLETPLTLKIVFHNDTKANSRGVSGKAKIWEGYFKQRRVSQEFIYYITGLS